MTLPLDWAKIQLDFDKKQFLFDFRQKKLQQNSDPLTAANICIEEITKKFPPPYTLYLSGGVDSQAMLYAWIKSKVEFQTYSAVYNHKLNEHDLVALAQFAKIHDVEINYQEFDLIKFLADEHDTYARTYYSGSPQFTSFMKMVDNQTEGTAIMSGNFLQLDSIKSGYPKYINRPSKNALSLYFYSYIKNKNFIPFFFLESYDLAYSFTINEYINQIYDYYYMGSTEKDVDLGLVEVYNMKIAFYQSHGFPVIKQCAKLNGFEKVKEYYDLHYQHLVTAEHKLSRTYKQKSTRTFDVLYRNKYEARLSDHTVIIQ